MNPVRQQIETADLSGLAQSDQDKDRSMLRQHASVFATSNSDLGCTNLFAHDMPLVDEVPIRQRNRQIHQSDYDKVRAHIRQLTRRISPPKD